MRISKTEATTSQFTQHVLTSQSVDALNREIEQVGLTRNVKNINNCAIDLANTNELKSESARVYESKKESENLVNSLNSIKIDGKPSEPQNAITETALAAELVEKMSQTDINTTCQLALDNVIEHFNRDQLLIRVVSGGESGFYNDVESQRINPNKPPYRSGISIEGYVKTLVSNGAISSPRLSASLIMPYANVSPYAGSANLISGFGALIASPKYVVAAGPNDLNSSSNNNDGTLSYAEDSKAKGLDYVAEFYKNKKVASNQTNEVILNQIDKDEFKGIFVWMFNNQTIPSNRIAAALWHQAKAFQESGMYVPIFIYHTQRANYQNDSVGSQMQLLHKNEAEAALKDKTLKFSLADHWIDYISQNMLLPE